MVKIIGISSLYHDSAAALVIDGEIKSAAQEERFTRIKHDSSLPKNAFEYCMESENLKPKDIDYIIFYEKPFLKWERLLETYASFSPEGFGSFKVAIPIWIKEKLFQKKMLIKFLESYDKNINWKSRLLFSEHHLSHAASAFYPSPFQSSAILTLDGVGEWTTTSFAVGEQNNISIKKEIHFPHSLGLLYSAFTFFNGFKVNSGEYKLMGLAPYGEPKYVDKILENLIDVKNDGSFRLNQHYFEYSTGLKMTNENFSKLFNCKPREPESKIKKINMDLAASIQSVTEEIILKLVKNIKTETNHKNLCLAGGVALNCVANGKIQNSKIFENIWIQPAAGDAGGALGSALYAHFSYLNNKREHKKNDSMKGAYLGPSFSNLSIEKSLNKLNAKYNKYDEEEIIELTANALANNKSVGWFQGRMEFGPRALGARSILANPSDPDMQTNLNLKVKFRESFRPFAPAILEEELEKWFNIDCESPYMMYTAKIKDEYRIYPSDKEAKLNGINKVKEIRSVVPAITHIDYSSRIQSVNKYNNKKFYYLIAKFNQLTDIPILINTSFNIRGEPIVCTPEDAYRCFMNTGLDILVIGDFILDKTKQGLSNRDNLDFSQTLD